MTELRVVCAWTLQAVLCTRTITVKSVSKVTKEPIKLPHSAKEREGKIVVYRAYFLKLQGYPKELRDQLVIELPTLQALRPGEVSSLKVEYLDFDNGDMQVLDSKKNVLMTVPLDPVVAEHLLEYIQREDLADGIVIQPLASAHHTGRKKGSQTRGEGLSVTQIERIWAKWCRLLGLPKMSPRMGRAYFATKWHFVDRKSMMGLKAILRHDSIQSTEHYLNKIVSYEDTKAEFNEGLKSPFRSECSRSDKCPMAAPDCYCRMFTPELMVQAKKEPTKHG